MKKTIIVEIIYEYEIEIDMENSILEEYDSENEMLFDYAARGFEPDLPLIADGGIVIKRFEVLEVN